jgi:hypothetical protein
MDDTPVQTRINAAIAAFSHNDGSTARRLIASVLDENPSNEDAWFWASEFAITTTERIDCLNHILNINPGNQTARNLLVYLQKPQPKVTNRTILQEGTPPGVDIFVQQETPPPERIDAAKKRKGSISPKPIKPVHSTKKPIPTQETSNPVEAAPTKPQPGDNKIGGYDDQFKPTSSNATHSEIDAKPGNGQSRRADHPFESRDVQPVTPKIPAIIMGDDLSILGDLVQKGSNKPAREGVPAIIWDDIRTVPRKTNQPGKGVPVSFTSQAQPQNDLLPTVPAHSPDGAIPLNSDQAPSLPFNQHPTATKVIRNSPLFDLPVLIILLILAVALGIYGYLYYQTDLLGNGMPDYDKMVISKDFTEIINGNLRWKITYESSRLSRYEGLVRHTSPNRITNLSILTHDILVTTGDYADKSQIKTNVDNHRFTWKPLKDFQPSGRINLLHTLPISKDVFTSLAKIQNDNKVIITGYEILAIEVYKDGKLSGTWQDTGCNTLLVNSVTNQKNP